METAEVKAILGIPATNTKHDAYFDTIVPLLIEYSQDKSHQTFENGAGEVSLPGGVKVFVAKAAEYNMGGAGVSARSMGEVSYSYETEFPESISKFLKPYKKLRW